MAEAKKTAEKQETPEGVKDGVKPDEVSKPDDVAVVQGNSLIGQEPGDEQFAYTPPKG